jgi:hypothetical protein
VAAYIKVRMLAFVQDSGAAILPELEVGEATKVEAAKMQCNSG